MAQHTNRKDRPAAKLILRKETIRSLRTLSEEELRGAVGGAYSPPPPRPSCATC
jgi:hypothetical protein